MDRIDEIIKKAQEKLGERINLDVYPGDRFSKEYDIFRQEALDAKLTRYESWCNKAETIIKTSVSPDIRTKVEESIKRCHLNMTPEGASSFATIVGLLITGFGLLIGIISFLMR